MTRKRLGNVLAEAGLVSGEQLNHALDVQQQTKQRLGEVLVDEEFVSETDVARALHSQLGVEYTNLVGKELDPSLKEVVGRSLARRYKVVPIDATEDNVYLAMSDPLNFMAIEAIKTASRRAVVPSVSPLGHIESAIERLYGKDSDSDRLTQKRSDSPPPLLFDTLHGQVDVSPKGLVERVVEYALSERAGAIHFDQRAHDMPVRVRAGNNLHTILTILEGKQESIVTYLKQIGNLDVSERATPQEGSARLRAKDQEVEVHFHTLPTTQGEKIVLTAKRQVFRTFKEVEAQLTNTDHERINALLSAGDGMLLIAGPRGCGKTETLKALIRALNSEALNVVALARAIDDLADGVNSVQVNDTEGLTYASALRSIVQQDVDVIAVDALEDAETATISAHAAGMGHYVFLTMREPDAQAALSHLLACGVSPQLALQVIRGILVPKGASREAGERNVLSFSEIATPPEVHKMILSTNRR